MPGTGRDAAEARKQHYREAIAQWQLALRTEVKRSSSLPTAMFDACDPMLETRLAETAEAMLARLQEPSPSLASASAPTGEQRLEQVSAADLRLLPRQITADPGPPISLEDGLTSEYLAILSDVCCNASGPPQERAVELLCRDFSLSAETDFTQLTRLLADQLRHLGSTPTAAVEAELQHLGRRIAAALTLYAPSTAGPGDA